MIFRTLDLHINTKYGPEPVDLARSFRVKTNHIVDSFSIRIPKRTETKLFHKLNVEVANENRQNNEFYSLEGIASVEIVDPTVASIYEASREEAVDRSIGYLLRGVRLAAQHDPLFSINLPLWEKLLSESNLEYDYDCGISRSQSSRRLRAETVIRVTPTAYHYQILIKNNRTKELVQRHTVKTTECLWPHYRGLGFSRIRWEDDFVLGLTADDKEAFRFQVGGE